MAFSSQSRVCSKQRSRVKSDPQPIQSRAAPGRIDRPKVGTARARPTLRHNRRVRRRERTERTLASPRSSAPSCMYRRLCPPVRRRGPSGHVSHEIPGKSERRALAEDASLVRSARAAVRNHSELSFPPSAESEEPKKEPRSRATEVLREVGRAGRVSNDLRDLARRRELDSPSWRAQNRVLALSSCLAPYPSA